MRTLARLSALLALAAACAEPPAPGVAGPHVVVVTLDTLRRDATSLHGYALPTTPRLQELARSATVYERCTATAPWTVPTHASLFTGRFPFEHGARSVGLDAITETGGDNALPLPAAHTTLAEALRGAGYETAAFVTNQAYLAPRHGLDQGYDLYEVAGGRAALRNRRVFEWLEDRDPARPLHLFVNYMDTHRPYNVRPLAAFTSETVPSDSAARLDELYEAVLGRGEPADPGLVATLRAQYDLAIANVDRSLGALLDRLEELGYWENTLLVVTSDHGEYFGEHGLVEHSKDVYEEAVAVPLLVHAPGQTQGARVMTRVSSAHVPRLIAEHLPAPLRDLLVGLFPYAPASGVILAQSYYARRKDLEDPRFGARFDRVRTAWYEGDLKYVHSSDGAHELYDLAADPREERDLAAERVEDAGRMRDALLVFLATSPHTVEPAGGPEPLAEGDAEALRATGYLQADDG